ncbi:hypothetical protein [Streptomyces sp. NPDC057675]|uniref:hypothetical protein n=1 Tax=Streptomyces sp. NPDC057675 TaxID=3346204 RepID=UPI0036A8A452
MVAPHLQLAEDTDMSVDARTAEPIEISMPDDRAAAETSSIGWSLPQSTDGTSSVWEFSAYSTLFVGQVGPSAPPGRFSSFLGGSWTTPSDRFSAAWTRQGSYYTGFTHHVRAGELATLKISAGA